MEDDPFRYDSWIEDALRGVIRHSLTYAAEHGLPGDHHFYITYLTDGDDVELPSYLRADHQEEMTIVLQHEFEELVVTEEAFWVTLRFNGKPERLRVPFHAVISFTDPSVNFSLQIKTALESDGGIETDMAVAGNFEIEGTEASPEHEAAQGGDDERSGEVIALDAFRKK